MANFTAFVTDSGGGNSAEAKLQLGGSKDGCILTRKPEPKMEIPVRRKNVDAVRSGDIAAG